MAIVNGQGQLSVNNSRACIATRLPRGEFKGRSLLIRPEMQRIHVRNYTACLFCWLFDSLGYTRLALVSYALSFATFLTTIREPDHCLSHGEKHDYIWTL